MTPDHELDELLRAVRSRFIARTEAGFDVAAGLADVRRRAAALTGGPGTEPGLEMASWLHRPEHGEPPPRRRPAPPSRPDVRRAGGRPDGS